MSKNDDMSFLLSEFIYQVKQELLSQDYVDKKNPLFKLEELTIEVGFTAKNKVEGGFDLRLIKLTGAEEDEIVQKAILKFTPILDTKEFVEELKKDPETMKKLKEHAKTAFFKSISGPDEIAPQR